MIYEYTALKNMIIDNIDNKAIVWIACRLYCRNLPIKERRDLENELTKHLLNKQYSKPEPKKNYGRKWDKT